MQCTSGTRDDASVSVSTSRSPSLFESRPFHENEEAEMQSWNSVEKGGISRIHVRNSFGNDKPTDCFLTRAILLVYGRT